MNEVRVVDESMSESEVMKSKRMDEATSIGNSTFNSIFALGRAVAEAPNTATIYHPIA